MDLIAMIGKRLVHALDDDWRKALDAVGRARGYPPSSDVASLGAKVAKLSRAYNEGAAMPKGSDLLAARLLFSFPRDVPKGAGAVRELVANGALALKSDRPLRVLDLGAGLGATTWGVARALEASGQSGAIEATWVDADAPALETALSIARARSGKGAVTVTARAVQHDLARGLPRVAARFDVVLLGQVLSELDAGLDEAARAAKHADMLATLLESQLTERGALVVVEPALRDRTRHLHRVRDAVLATRPGALVAPCLHEAPCPALARETDWCHEDLSVDLPEWLVPVARAAGLRYQGLTFSYLVLRAGADTRALAASFEGSGRRRLRVVSEPFVSKGKREVFVCGELAGGAVGRARAMRLDRDESETNRAFDDLARGDLVVIDPPLDPGKPRVGKDAAVEPLD